MEAAWAAADTPSKLLQSPYSVLQDIKATSEVALAGVVVSVVASAVIEEVSAVTEEASADVVVLATKAVVVLVVDKVATKADHHLLMHPAGPEEEVGMVVVTKIDEMAVTVEAGTIAVELEVTEIQSVDEIEGMKTETVIETGIEIETATATETVIGTATGTAMVEIDETTTMVLASDITRMTGMTTQESDGINILPSQHCIISTILCITCITVGWLAGGYSMVTVFPLPFWGPATFHFSSDIMVRTSSSSHVYNWEFC